MKKNKKILLLIAVILLLPITVYAKAESCPLGPNVTEDIKGALRVIQILGPLITIIFSIWDFFRSLAKGDIEKNVKALGAKVAKRIFATFMLFFIPLLINQAFILFGLYTDESCNLDTKPASAETCAEYGESYDEETGKCSGALDKTSFCASLQVEGDINTSRNKCNQNSNCRYVDAFAKCVPK